MFSTIPPHAHAGMITTRCCPKFGSQLRVEIIEYMMDMELPTIVNHYSLLNGPAFGGYRVFFNLRGEEFNRMVLMEFTLGDSSGIQGAVHDYVDEPTSPIHPFVHQSEDGGVILTRHSWLTNQESGREIYEFTQRVVNKYLGVNSSRFQQCPSP